MREAITRSKPQRLGCMVAILTLLGLTVRAATPFAPDSLSHVEITTLDSGSLQVGSPWFDPFSKNAELVVRVQGNPGLDDDWKKPLIVSFYDADGERIFQQEIELHPRRTVGCPVHRMEHGTHLRREFSLFRVAVPGDLQGLARIEIRAQD